VPFDAVRGNPRRPGCYPDFLEVAGFGKPGHGVLAHAESPGHFGPAEQIAWRWLGLAVVRERCALRR
jgi:hypothetical protein